MINRSKVPACLYVIATIHKSNIKALPFIWYSLLVVSTSDNYRFSASWQAPIDNKLSIKLNILWVYIIAWRVWLWVNVYPAWCFAHVDDDNDENDMRGVFKHVNDPCSLGDTGCLSWLHDVECQYSINAHVSQEKPQYFGLFPDSLA